MHGWADEAISEIFISIIIMLSRLKADDLVKQNKELLNTHQNREKSNYRSNSLVILI
jgi:hypothetical protein